MLTVFQARKSIPLNLSLLVALTALGACSNFNSLRSPVFTGSTANQQQILSSSTTPLGGTYVGTGGVQGNDLPPPPGSAQAPQYTQQTYGTTQTYSGAQGPQPYIPPLGYVATGDPTPVTQLASAEPGEMQLGTPPSSLGDQAAQIQRRTPRGEGGTHLVQQGDTAWNISQRYGI